MPAPDALPQDRSLLGRLAGISFKRRRSVLLGWLVVVAIAVGASMTLRLIPAVGVEGVAPRPAVA